MRILVFVLAILISLTSLAGNSSSLEEYEVGNFKKSFELVKKELKAKKDSPELMLLAAHYARGLATKRNFNKVEELLVESERYTAGVNGCSLNKMAIKYHIFSNYLFKVANDDTELKNFAEGLARTAESKYAFKLGVCPRLDKVSNFVVY